jgi:putative DNA primase/helicase
MMALWTLFAHAHDAFNVSPLLAFTSPEMGSGKSTALTLLSVLVPRPLPTANLTTSVIFRAIEKYNPTVLADEADTYFSNENDEMRGVLNSGWLRPLAQVLRGVGDEHETRLFSTWGPKAYALIGEPPGTLADRSWKVKMRRQLPEEAKSITPLPLDRLYEFEPLRQKAWRWAQDNLENIRAAVPQVPGCLSNRAADNARPLLAVADVAGGVWPQRAREAVLLLLGAQSAEAPTLRVKLLSDIRAIFNSAEYEGHDRIPSADLVAALVAIEDAPWSELNHGKPLTAAKLARLLGPFSITPDGIRTGPKSTARGYLREAFDLSWASYLPVSPSQSATMQQANVYAGSRVFQSATGGELVAPSKREIANENAGCCTVALPKGGRGGLVHGEPGEDIEVDL